jgi:hypothetical protein
MLDVVLPVPIGLERMSDALAHGDLIFDTIKVADAAHASVRSIF